MADTRITALAEDVSPAPTDLVTTVDVSDPSMSSAGTNKKVLLSNLLKNVISTDVMHLSGNETTSGTKTFVASASGSSPLLVRALAGQTGNLVEVQDPAGVAVVRVNPNGRILLGPIDTALEAQGGSGPGLVVNRATSATALFQYTATGSATSGGTLFLTQNAGVATVAGDRLGAVIAGGWNPTSNYGFGGAIGCFADGTFSATNAPTYLTFETAPAGSVLRQERMRIRSDGQVRITNVDSSVKPLLVQGAASQVASLTEWQDQTGAILAAITPSGRVYAQGLAIPPGASAGAYLQSTDSAGNAAWAPAVRTLFSAAPGHTIANSAVETSMVNPAAGIGSLTLPAGLMNQVGKMLRITASGVYGTFSTPPAHLIYVKFGGLIAAVCQTNTMTASMTQRRWSLECLITTATIGSAGQVNAGGYFIRWTSPTAATELELGGTLISVDLTAAQTIYLSWLWGTANAANTITTTNFTLEAMN